MRIFFILTGIFFGASAVVLQAPSTVVAGIPFTVTWTTTKSLNNGANDPDPQTFYLRSAKSLSNDVAQDASDPIQVSLSAESASMTISDTGTFAVMAFETTDPSSPFSATGNINVTPAVGTIQSSSSASSERSVSHQATSSTATGAGNGSTSQGTGAISSTSVTGNDVSSASVSTASNSNPSLTVSGSKTIIVSGSQTYSDILETNSQGSVTQTLVLPSGTGSVNGNTISSATGKKSRVGLIVGLLLGFLLLIFLILLVIFVFRRHRQTRLSHRPEDIRPRPTLSLIVPTVTKAFSLLSRNNSSTHSSPILNQNDSKNPFISSSPQPPQYTLPSLEQLPHPNTATEPLRSAPYIMISPDELGRTIIMLESALRSWDSASDPETAQELRAEIDRLRGQQIPESEDLPLYTSRPVSSVPPIA